MLKLEAETNGDVFFFSKDKPRGREFFSQCLICKYEDKYQFLLKSHISNHTKYIFEEKIFAKGGKEQILSLRNFKICSFGLSHNT